MVRNVVSVSFRYKLKDYSRFECIDGSADLEWILEVKACFHEFIDFVVYLISALHSYRN